MQAAALSAANLEVRFGGTAALKNVDLEIRSGEVLGLVGANGAGKSTLLKVLAGAIPHGSFQGTLYRRGRSIELNNPHDAEALGIGIVPQELLGVPELSVMENIVLERYPRAGLGRIAWRRARAEATAALRALGTSISIESQFSNISASAQQLVQIARVIHGEAEIVLLDEPTSSLSPPEVTALCQVMRRMRDEGRAVVFITHRLAEVFDVCDRIQVLQDGRSSGIFDARVAKKDEIIRAMLGQELKSIFPVGAVRKPGRALLEVSKVSGAATSTSTSVRNVTFALHEGEILGLFGLVGAGRTELLDLLFGIRRSLPGSSVRLDSVDITNKSPRQILEAGMGLVTEDRKRTGVVLDMSVRANLMMASFERIARHGIIQRERENAISLELIRNLGIRAANSEMPIRSLSGGNQQKVVLGKWLNRRPKVLLLDEPTRGIDVGAKAEVFRILADLAAEGMAILLVSSEVAEIALFCDRALVMYRGGIVSEARGADLTEATLMRSATGLAAA